MGRRGGSRGGRRGGFGSRSHSSRGGGGRARPPPFPIDTDPSWTNEFKHGLFDCWTYPLISVESFFCRYCMFQKITNVLSKPDWTEQDSCFGQMCFVACLLDYCSYGVGTPVFLGCQLLPGVQNRYQINDHGDGCCSRCAVACFCAPCLTQRLAYELTSQGEFPGKILCSSRPRNCPSRPPPRVMPMSDSDQLLAVSMGQMNVNNMNNMNNNNNNLGMPLMMQTAGDPNMMPMMQMQMQMHQQNQQQNQHQQMGGGDFTAPPQPYYDFGNNNNNNNNTNNNMGYGAPPPPPPPPPSSGGAPMPGFVSFQ